MIRQQAVESKPTLWPPWGFKQPDPNTVYFIPIDKMVVPDLRVTSTFTPEQEQELVESIRTEGQKLPIETIWINNQLVLCDGLNRLLAMRALGITSVKAIVKEGTMRDVQISNIITARHRGRENPAQTAEVIKDLLDNEHMPTDEIKRKLGISDTTFRRLLAISKLPAEVKDAIKYGKLGVLAGYHIAQLSDVAAQLELTGQAVAWKYTEDQVKARVVQLLNPDVDAPTNSYVFEPDGRPQIVLPRCSMCDIEVSTALFPVAHCEHCSEAYSRFREYYKKQLSQPTV